MKKPKESDWKLFRAMVDDLREKYLKEKNVEILKELTNLDKTATEQFWNTLDKMQKEKEILQHCLDGHKRSKMFLYIQEMVRYGMMTNEDLKNFSDEIQNSIKSRYLR